MRYYKKILLIISVVTSLSAKIHYAKLEPIETITVKSEVSGRVTVAKESLEGKMANGLIIKIDDALDKIRLKKTEESLMFIKKMIELNQNMLKTLKENLKKKKRLYEKIANVVSTSENSKITIFAAYVSAKNQLFLTQEKILNLKNQKTELEQKIAALTDTISKKSIFAKNRYLYKLFVRKGELVTAGMNLATLSDISMAKLTIFLSDEELKNLKNKKIYINGKKTDLKFSKIWKIADSKYISSYRAEIVLKPFAKFSTLIKVEIK